MPADAGTIVLRSDSRKRISREFPVRKIEVGYTTTAGGAFEQTLNERVSGQILQIGHRPGAVAPTALSDLAIFTADEDTAQAEAIITAAGDGLDLVSTAFKKKVVTAPQPVVDGKLRFQITGNLVANATGILWVWVV